jgi:formylglycine-generating enzyme required for sulfatase activity
MIGSMKSLQTFVCAATCCCVSLSCAGLVLAQASEQITNSIGMKLALIPKGTFIMGSPPSEEGSTDDEFEHEVTISSDYYLGVFEVTQSQYQKVMGKNPSHFLDDKLVERHPKTGRVVKKGDSSNHPVEMVSWAESVLFCKRLSDLPEERNAGRQYRLPTEAEWEYACRAGSVSPYGFGQSVTLLSDYGWWSANSQERTHAVGLKDPNKWGLYDMHGNVWEWCSDWYAEYPQGAVTDPARSKVDPSSRSNNFGFRVVLTLTGTSE